MHYVIIGSSAAGTAAASTIRRNDADGTITILSKDAQIFSRCQLHMVASGERSAEKSRFLPADWAEKFKVNLRFGTTVSDINAKEKKVLLESGESVLYDKLLIATGSRTFFPPINGLVGKQTVGLRDMEDAQAILEMLPQVESVAIIGAGLVGCELATSISKMGKQVSLIEMAPWPLPMQLEELSGAQCANLLKKAGVELYCSETVNGVTRDADGLPTAVTLKSGASIPAQLVVCAAGVRSNIEFAAGTGVTTGRGILIDKQCRTNIEDIWAAGDVCEIEDTLLHQVMPSAIWPVANRQGRVAGASMTGADDTLARNTGFRASVGLCGVNIVSLGPAARPDPAWNKQVVSGTRSNGLHWIRILYTEGNQLRAAILWGDILDAGVYAEAIINQRTLDQETPYLDHLDGAKRGAQKVDVL